MDRDSYFIKVSGIWDEQFIHTSSILSILTSFLNILSASELFTIWIGQLPSLRDRRNSVTTICNFPCSQNPTFSVAGQYSSPIQGYAMDLDVKDFQI